ncbi:Thermolysin metallopeptidase, catalytic domain [Geodermatophilus saharensis]|uniref:Neutral metalloproteinase n=1 Tax=Geodermatophilus saharensis TaxID=1137994 RepID=A0A239BUA3_9ACTN|nr:M4 family metallopeptidase [Geodermatophilus saharensis]SNS10634.1 Thermolysin metallopeptidase, catalytic domain [Geodermatophilus saharensis]
MSASAIVLAVAGTVVASLFALYTSFRLSKESSRTSARLIYGELTRNSAAVAYFLRTGTWPRAKVDAPVWTQRSESIAKMRRVVPFNSIYKGYAALEALAFVAQEGDRLGPSSQQILRTEVDVLRNAISMAGEIAKIDRKEIDENLKTLEVRASAASASAFVHVQLGTGFVPPEILRHVWAQAGVAHEALGQPSEAPSDQTSSPGTETRAGAPDARLMRRVYDAQHSRTGLRRHQARSEGEPPVADITINEIFDAMGNTHRFLWEAFRCDLQEFTGSPMTAIAHYGERYDNVYWDGTQLVVGDGDGQLFNRFSASPEVVAHELCHAVVSGLAGLRFANQAGALSEALCDIFGVLTAQFAASQTTEKADWLVGARLLRNGDALRSLKSPGTAYANDPVLGTDRQVAHLQQLVRTPDDNGGVHINSGIPAHAFYRTAMALGGYAWERAGLIWFEALKDPSLRPASGFTVFAGCTVGSAVSLFGEATPEHQAVLAAWEDVGVHPRPRPQAATPMA